MLTPLVFVSAAFALSGVSIEAGAASYYNKDYVSAFKQWALLARNDEPRAQHNIGVLYFNGEGVKGDKRKARLWFERAAKLGNAPSAHNLGWIYEYGLGVKKNLERARAWYAQAARQGFAPSESKLGLLLFQEGKYSQAKVFLSRAAARGQARAQFLLGEIYARGLLGKQDGALALRWYQVATNNGDGDAAYALARHYLGLEKRNEVKIANLLNRAAERGNIAAINALGWAFIKGIGVSEDEDKAQQLFLISAQAGYGQAAFNLSALHFTRGDFAEGYKWLLIAQGLGANNLANEAQLFLNELDGEEQEEASGQARKWLVDNKKGKAG